MSKTVNSEKAEPRELKALFIVGLDMRPNSKILEIYDQENCLVIGDGKSTIKITDVEELLDKHNLRISPNTRIDICAHGRRVEEEHTLNLENKKIKTKDFLQQLQNLSPQNPLYIHIWACHGGTANKDVEILNPGSIIVTHIESKYIVLNITEDFSLLTSITRYMREDNLSPHLQYLYDQLENYQATTFNQIEDNGHIMKFKSIRNLEPDSGANIILNSLQQKNTSEELIKKLQNYQALEAKRFHEVLKDYVSFTDIEQFQNHISNISDLDVKNYITGTVMNLITVTTYKDMKVNDEVADIRDNILNNLNPELVNHSILNITPLYVAVHNNKLEITEALLAKGANPNEVDKNGCSLLYIACDKNFPEIANLLLKKGVNPNISDNSNHTPLMEACFNNSLDLVDALLTKGVNPNIVSKDKLTPLIIACSKNSERIVLHLLKNNADPNVVDHNGIIPLLAAYKNRSARIMEFLLEKEANPNVINRKTGTTLLYSAYNDNNLKIFRLLINHRANPNLSNIDGTTTLMAACEKGDLETAILLLKYGADINKSNIKGNTPMRLACKNGNLELVKMLVENGANLEIEHNSNTILSIAERYDHTKVKAFLETEINTQRILSKLDKNNSSYNPPPPKPPRLPKLESLNRRAWVLSTNINSNINHPKHDFFNSNRGTENKLSKEIINSAIEAIDKVSPINNETHEEIKNILSEELQKIPINNLIVNKKGIINFITEELKLNNQQNNNMGYQTSQQNLREIGNRVLNRYVYRPQTQTTNSSAHKWQGFVKPNNNYQGRG